MSETKHSPLPWRTTKSQPHIICNDGGNKWIARALIGSSGSPRFIADPALEVFSLANQAIKTFDPGFPAEGAALRASFDVYTRFLGRDNSEEVSRMAVTRSDIQNAAEAFELARAALQGGQGNG